MKYHYDQVSSYEEILQEVKRLIIPTIIESICSEDAINFGLNEKELAEVIYSQIMALAYNNKDINLTLDDLMPTRNHLIYSGTEETDAINMAMHLCAVCHNFPSQILAFQVFHQMTQNLKPFDEIIKNVKMQLLQIS